MGRSAKGRLLEAVMDLYPSSETQWDTPGNFSEMISQEAMRRSSDKFQPDLFTDLDYMSRKDFSALALHTLTGLHEAEEYPSIVETSLLQTLCELVQSEERMDFLGPRSESVEEIYTVGRNHYAKIARDRRRKDALDYWNYD